MLACVILDDVLGGWGSGRSEMKTRREASDSQKLGPNFHCTRPCPSARESDAVSHYSMCIYDSASVFPLAGNG